MSSFARNYPQLWKCKMNSDISHRELNMVSKNLDLGETKTDILLHEKVTNQCKKKIIICIIFMVISSLITLYFVVERRTSAQTQSNTIDIYPYIKLQTNLAKQGDTQALIWLANSGNADSVILDKLRLLIESSTNPEIIEAAIKADRDLSKDMKNHKGFSKIEIDALKERAIQLGSTKYLMERLMGDNK